MNRGGLAEAGAALSDRALFCLKYSSVSRISDWRKARRRESTEARILLDLKNATLCLLCQGPSADIVSALPPPFPSIPSPQVNLGDFVLHGSKSLAPGGVSWYRRDRHNLTVFRRSSRIRDKRTSVSCSCMGKSLVIWVDGWGNRGISMLSTVSGHCSIECGAHRPVHLMLSNQHALIAHVKM